MIFHLRNLMIVLVVCILTGCQPPQKYHKITGETMGTYYMVTYEGIYPERVKKEIEVLLKNFNQSLSTYIPTSLISRLNKSESGVILPAMDPYFEPVLARSKELKNLTKGKLNVSIMPLLRYWRDSSTAIDTLQVIKLLNLVEKSEFTIKQESGSQRITKSFAEAELDFSSLAKGYGIDVVSEYFEKKGIQNYLVDIGGEARAQGVNSIKQPWTLAINKPVEGSGLDEIELIIKLDNTSIATSGTYRQFYEKDGIKIAHIMDPISGYSTNSDLLSVSVIADDCMTADGLATALMVGDLEEAKTFLKKNNFPACLIYDADGKAPLEKFFANDFEKFVLKSK